LSITNFCDSVQESRRKFAGEKPAESADESDEVVSGDGGIDKVVL
jgi:hypothetical protein